MNIDDDADPEALEAWYRRTPDQIAAAKAAAWNTAWSALRLPDSQAYEPDGSTRADRNARPAPNGDMADAAATVGGRPRAPRPAPPAKTAWANQELGFLDVLASGETNQGDGGYDSLYTPPGHSPRRLPMASNGTPDYRQFPISQAWPVGPGKIKSAAGRYGITRDFWRDAVVAQPDITDWTP